MIQPLFDAVLKAMWESSSDAVIVADDTGHIMMTNPAVHAMLGWTNDDLVGQPVEILVPEESREIHRTNRGSYVKNPFPRRMGKASLLVALTKDGRHLPADISLTHVDYEGAHYTIAIVRNATERHQYEEELRHLSFHDALTGLYNRAFLDEELDRLERGRRRPVAILVADVDGLKRVNDKLGHQVGDELIVQTAETLKNALRTEDVLARTGGDEFVALLPDVDPETADIILKRVRGAFVDPLSTDPLQISVGIAVGEPGELLHDVLRAADSSMYRDKRARYTLREESEAYDAP